MRSRLDLRLRLGFVPQQIYLCVYLVACLCVYVCVYVTLLVELTFWVGTFYDERIKIQCIALRTQCTQWGNQQQNIMQGAGSLFSKPLSAHYNCYYCEICGFRLPLFLLLKGFIFTLISHLFFSCKSKVKVLTI